MGVKLVYRYSVESNVWKYLLCQLGIWGLSDHLLLYVSLTSSFSSCSPLSYTPFFLSQFFLTNLSQSYLQTCLFLDCRQTLFGISHSGNPEVKIKKSTAPTSVLKPEGISPPHLGYSNQHSPTAFSLADGESSSWFKLLYSLRIPNPAVIDLNDNSHGLQDQVKIVSMYVGMGEVQDYFLLSLQILWILRLPCVRLHLRCTLFP